MYVCVYVCASIMCGVCVGWGGGGGVPCICMYNYVSVCTHICIHTDAYNYVDR